MSNEAVEKRRDLTRKERKDLGVLALFTSVYCKAHHGGEKTVVEADAADLQRLGLEKHQLCGQCRELLLYSFERRLRCPLDPKPVCKHCKVHCYKVVHREKVKRIMRFSGQYLIFRGRLDLLWRYFF